MDVAGGYTAKDEYFISYPIMKRNNQIWAKQAEDAYVHFGRFAKTFMGYVKKIHNNFKKNLKTATNSVPEFDHGLVVNVAVLGDGVSVDLEDLHATLLVGQRDFNLSEID